MSLYFIFLPYDAMKNFLWKLGKNIGFLSPKEEPSSQEKSSNIDFSWKMEEISENTFVFESYGQKTEIEVYDKWLFKIGKIIEPEKNIKLIADFINRWKNLAAEWYRNSIENIVGVSFKYEPDSPEYNVSVIFDIEHDNDPKEHGDEYESWYGLSQSIIEKKMFTKMNEQEKYIISQNAAAIAQYLNERERWAYFFPISEAEESV